MKKRKQGAIQEVNEERRPTGRVKTKRLDDEEQE